MNLRTVQFICDADVNIDVFEDPIFAPDTIEVPVYDSPTKVNLLDVGTMLDYWDRDEDIITVNAVAIDKDDPTAIRSQFDSGADATVTNLLIYLHAYQPYTPKFKCPVKLTGTVGTNDIHQLGEGFLYWPAPNPSGFLPSVVFILRIFPPPLSVLEKSSRLRKIGAQASMGKI